MLFFLITSVGAMGGIIGFACGGGAEIVGSALLDGPGMTAVSGGPASGTLFISSVPSPKQKRRFTSS
jgi:hypothetical protein